MAKRKEGHEVLFVEVPVALKERLRAIAKLNKRSMASEGVVAIERHVVAEEVAHTVAAKRKAKKGGK
jgi:hypothetical protein